MPNPRTRKKKHLNLSARRLKNKGSESLHRWRELKKNKDENSQESQCTSQLNNGSIPESQCPEKELCCVNTTDMDLSDYDCMQGITTSTPKLCKVPRTPQSASLKGTEYSLPAACSDAESDESDWLEGVPVDTQDTCKKDDPIRNKSDTPIDINGRRLVDMKHFISAIQKCGNHTPFDCSFVDMEVCHERQLGMISEYTFVCKMCKKIEKITTDDCTKDSKKLSLNTAVVSAFTSIGQNYSQLEEVCCCLDMPCMSLQTFKKHQELVDSAIHDCTWESMEVAAREEAAIAVSAGQVDANGVPEISVIVDGAWCKRSYKTNYNALSGVGCIIGLNTKKVLYIGVRNSYCCICARSRGKNIDAPEHVCYKNWSKTSTAMESDIIVEGFKKSMDMYNLKYINVIGDGDSSVMSKLIEAQPYGPGTTISKIECTNHLLRNYVRKLREASEQKRNEVGPVPGELRNKVKSNLLRLRYAVTGAIKYARSNINAAEYEKIRQLQEDIKNGPHHVFGDHSMCKPYFCQGHKEGELNLVEDMKTYGLWNQIMSANNYLAHFSFSLLKNVSTNLAECYNSIVCKFVAGKRINLSQRNTYTTRSEISALAMNEKEGYVRKLHKKITLGVSPGQHSKAISLRRQKKRLQPKKTAVTRRKKCCLFPDKDYGGEDLNTPDVDETTFDNRKAELLTSLSLNEDERNELEKKSRGQSTCELWVKERKKRITASNFGKICKLRKTTSRAKIVKQLLYKDFAGNASTRYGLENEKVAIAQLAELLLIQVEPCGLFIDRQYPFLAASPDGMYNNKFLVEVKCPAKAKDLTPVEAVKNKVIKYCTEYEGEIFLKKNHNYYYQVQGQLRVTNKPYCWFVVWTPHGMSVERIEKDDNFWSSNMEKRLLDFYESSLLPEIIDPRHPRGMPIRDRI